MWTTYWWEMIGEDSDLFGEEFFTALMDADAIDHLNYVKELFPNEEIRCLGWIDEQDAEMMGLDTY